MRKVNMRIFIFLTLASIYFVACKKTDETKFLSYKEFVNPKVGKYIIYQLDSTVTAAFGASFVKRSYLVKDSVVEKFFDNQNRETYKIFRYQYDPVAKTWNPSHTFSITPTDTRLEYVDNNLRYITLVNPISNFNSWLGNSYISTHVYNPSDYLSGWTFYYKDVDQPKQIGNLSFDKTITVVQYDSADNRPFDPLNYSQFSKSYEIYADSVGLVFKDVMSWEYQYQSTYSNCKLIRPKNPGPGLDTLSIDCNLSATNCDSLRQQPNHKVVCDTTLTGFDYNGYGVTQRIISHN